MKTLILAILIACSLGVSGCTEEKQSTGNKQLDEALGIKTEEKAEEPKKKEEKTETKKETKTTKKTETKKIETKQEDEEMREITDKEILAIDQCPLCGELIHDDNNYVVTKDSFMCRSCYNEGYCKCMDCGKRVNVYDKGTTTGSDGVRCPNCTKEYEDSIGEDFENCDRCGARITNSESVEHDGQTLCYNCYFAEHDQVGDAPED